jgi:anti-sigma regulatory factor (Ser/Thr protein kinase)
MVAAGPTLRLSVSNQMALDLPVGEIIGNRLAERIPLPPELRNRIACVVHEAVLNAVLHGNLAIGNGNRGHTAGVDDLQNEIETRLCDPAVLARRCEIRTRWNAMAILVRVTDQGAGFEPMAWQEDAIVPWGRGIRVIAALASRCRWVRGGRSLILRFAR